MSMPSRSRAQSIDEYIAEFPPETRKVLEEMRELIRSAAPGATETMSYAMPTFDLNRKHVVHFAAFKNHVGFFPTGSGVEAFKDEITPYKTSKGTIQLPLDQPLPKDLIRRIVEFRVAQTSGKAQS